ncbi:hypothetical protein CEUSTIGMA_g12751.t1 [Chlamydomonas eustigma]|uniref:mannan endo-1,4-beta-mannosidase n=1 Tax=Chlamydomonas eustigma TaxID=1157962 RepID=A0A250XQK4_9CHLO|nr:hypothetical protein CEUSTIGMA_g12751.t1 [Chlamydomonas eustigma]|eukprot:GAX85334.1 hypothetical protein CEUSTIGMA_g12751.t1 [Chlamydomonas eustigma]
MLLCTAATVTSVLLLCILAPVLVITKQHHISSSASSTDAAVAAPSPCLSAGSSLNNQQSRPQAPGYDTHSSAAFSGTVDTGGGAGPCRSVGGDSTAAAQSSSSSSAASPTGPTTTSSSNAPSSESLIPSTPVADSPFISINEEGQFACCGIPFFVVGLNAYDLTEVALITTNTPQSQPQDLPSMQSAAVAAVGISRDSPPPPSVPPVVHTSMTTLKDLSGRELVLDSLSRAASQGLNTVRTWAHTSNEETPFQVSPGKYNEAGLQALDYVLYTCSKLGLRVILSLIDNWHYYNGVDQYVDWSRTAPERLYNRPPDDPGDPSPDRIQGVTHSAGQAAGSNVSSGDHNQDTAGGGTKGENYSQQGIRLPTQFIFLNKTRDSSLTNLTTNATSVTLETDNAMEMYEKERHALFWSDPDCMSTYRHHMQTITLRRNTFTGLLYKDDPTILAWDLVNEPRCEGRQSCPSDLQAWIERMSAFLKLLDPKHLVTVGSEGFFGPSTPELLKYNPGSWASATGQDFVLNNAAKSIDFATIHAWPDNWGLGNSPYLPFIESWISSHTDHIRFILQQAESDCDTVTDDTEDASLLLTSVPPQEHPPGPGPKSTTPSANTSLRCVQDEFDRRRKVQIVTEMWKPVLLEEFGKKLTGNNLSSEGIASWRDPVYDWTYQVVQRRLILQQQQAIPTEGGDSRKQSSAVVGHNNVSALSLVGYNNVVSALSLVGHNNVSALTLVGRRLSASSNKRQRLQTKIHMRRRRRTSSVASSMREHEEQNIIHRPLASALSRSFWRRLSVPASGDSKDVLWRSNDTVTQEAQAIPSVVTTDAPNNGSGMVLTAVNISSLHHNRQQGPAVQSAPAAAAVAASAAPPAPGSSTRQQPDQQGLVTSSSEDQSTTELLQKSASKRGRPLTLLGSLFWEWQVPVFNMDTG